MFLLTVFRFSNIHPIHFFQKPGEKISGTMLQYFILAVLLQATYSSYFLEVDETTGTFRLNGSRVYLSGANQPWYIIHQINIKYTTRCSITGLDMVKISV